MHWAFCRNQQDLSTGEVYRPNYPCKNNWWGRPLLPEILDQTDRVGAKSPIFDLFSLSRNTTPSEKKLQLTLIESPLRAFQ